MTAAAFALASFLLGIVASLLLGFLVGYRVGVRDKERAVNTAVRAWREHVAAGGSAG